MKRQLLCAVAVSALAAWSGGCAGVQNLTALSGANAPKAPKVAAAQTSSAAAPSTALAGAAPASTNLEEQLQAAERLRAQGSIPEAVRALAQLVLIAPDDARVIGEYGKALVQQGRPDDAVAFLKRAAELKSSDYTVYSALGVAYDQMDDRKNAAAAYERALMLHPGDANVLNNYAVSRMLAGDLDGAQKLLDQAKATGGRNPKIESNLQMLAQMRAKKPAATQTAAGSGSGAPKPIAASYSDPAQPRTVVMQAVPAESKSSKPTPHKLAALHSSRAAAAKSANRPPPNKPVAKQAALPALRTAD